MWIAGLGDYGENLNLFSRLTLLQSQAPGAQEEHRKFGKEGTTQLCDTSWAWGQELTSGGCHPQLQHEILLAHPGKTCAKTQIHFLPTHQKEKGKKEREKKSLKVWIWFVSCFQYPLLPFPNASFILNSSNLHQ